MREKRWLQNKKIREAAMAAGLTEGSEVIIRERSILKDGHYITREIRRGRVLVLYPYHFYCLMEKGHKESFRYNELLGDEARLIRIKGNKIMEHKKAPERVLFCCEGEPLRWSVRSNRFQFLLVKFGSYNKLQGNRGRCWSLFIMYG